jgi:uncharacterized membrane protein YeaQ/YmgE (transglycosylase-associated protein family)
MTIATIIGWLVWGLIIGAIARLLLPGKDPLGCLATALLGIAGSVVGGLIGRAIFGRPEGEGWFNPDPSWIISILGAILLLWIWRAIAGRRA